MTRSEYAGASAKRGTEAPNLRLYVTAVLAGAYVLAWWTFGSRAPVGRAEAPSIETVSKPRAHQQVVTWYADLAPWARPPVQVPVGWHIADGATQVAITAAQPLPVRASRARPGRIRTRSS